MWDWSDRIETILYATILRVLPVSGAAGAASSTVNDVSFLHGDTVRTMAITAIVFFVVDFASARLSYLNKG